MKIIDLIMVTIVGRHDNFVHFHDALLVIIKHYLILKHMHVFNHA